VLHFFKKRNLTNGGARNTFIFLFKTNLLKRDSFIGDTVTSLVNDTVCTFTNLLNFLILYKIEIDKSKSARDESKTN
jgi:hypothetical protein